MDGEGVDTKIVAEFQCMQWQGRRTILTVLPRALALLVRA